MYLSLEVISTLVTLVNSNKPFPTRFIRNISFASMKPEHELSDEVNNI